ncbi:hypothetical protein K502DRAFT_364770 [Neoconidiobolus thromboides FSU 785]|nr:hypothetical protein K502DRAFT_364770 [Neoconidiobolus thromboides FSU 785]
MACNLDSYLSSVDNECHLCNLPGCERCNPSGECISCYNNQTLQLAGDKGCVLKPEYYCKNDFNEGIFIDGSCKKCDSNCYQCYGLKKVECLLCKDKIIQDQIEYPMIRKKNECKVITQDQFSNYFNNCGDYQIINKFGVCDLCPKNCISCTFNNVNNLSNFNYTCLSCDDSFNLIEGKCINNSTDNNNNHNNINENNNNNNINNNNSDNTPSNDSPNNKPNSSIDNTQMIAISSSIMIVLLLIAVLIIYKLIKNHQVKLNNQKKVMDYRWNLINHNNQTKDSQNSSTLDVPLTSLNKSIK